MKLSGGSGVVQSKKNLDLVVNLGSTSKRIAVYDGKSLIVDAYLSLSDNVYDFLESKGLLGIGRIGLRVVCPGTYFAKHSIIDSSFIKRLEKMKDYSFAHTVPLVDEIRTLKSVFSCRLYGISDSALYANVPLRNKVYGIGIKMARRYDVFRFGYHGLSVSWILRNVKPKGRVVICHLGGGSSVVAVKNKNVVDMSMGFSPLEGLMGGGRSGTIDAVAALYIKDSGKLSGKPTLLKRLFLKSGFLGLGGDSDMRKLLLNSKKDDMAVLAVEKYVNDVVKYIGGYAAEMGGIDELIFTGMMGRDSSVIRNKICRGLGFLGIELGAKVGSGDADIVDIIEIGRGKVKVRIARVSECDEIAYIMRNLD